MPYLENRDEEEKQQQAQQQGPLQLQAGSAQLGAPAPSVAAASSPAPAQPAASQNAGQTPGRYVNFQNYFNANRDAANATGNKLTAGIEKQGQAAQTGLAQKQAAFGTDVTRGMGAAAPGNAFTPPATGRMPTATNGATLGARPDGTGPSTTTAGNRQPAAATPSPLPPGAVAQRVEYSGPNSLSQTAGWEELVGNASRAASQANATASAAGLQSLLQDANKGQQYGAGASRFDAGLVGVGSRDRFAKLREAFGGLPKALTDADKASQETVRDARGRVGEYNAAVDAANAERVAQREAGTADAAAEAPARAAAAEEATMAAATKGSAIYKENYEKGPWGQVDIGTFGRGVAGTFGWLNGGTGKGDYQEVSDAGIFAHAADDYGLSSEEAKSVYERLTPDEVQELRWIAMGPTDIQRNPTPGHPYYARFEAGGGTAYEVGMTRYEAIFEAVQRFMERMARKYNF